MEALPLLSLGLVAIRLIFPLIRPKAGLSACFAFADLWGIGLGLLLGGFAIFFCIMAAFSPQSALGGRLDTTLLAVLLGALYGIPAVRWLGEDWAGVAEARKIHELPPGMPLWNVPVKVGSWVRVNLVVNEEGVAMARRGLPGILYSPLKIRWSEFTTSKAASDRISVALLDGRLLVFTGMAARMIEQYLSTRKKLARAS
jgi:hypothetical protein